MMWIAWILAALVVVIAVCACIGSQMKADHIAACTATFAAPPAAVFATITDFAAHPSWRTGLKSIEVSKTRDGRTRVVENGANGTLPLEVDELVAPTRLVTRIADEGLPFGGTWTFVFAPAGTGTTVTITERGCVKNALFRFLAHTVFSPTKTMLTTLTDLGRRHGETVVPAVVATEG